MVIGSDTEPNPLGSLGGNISDSELRETAYEVFIAVCRSSTGSKPLTYTPQSDKTTSTSSSSSSIERSLTSSLSSLTTSASKVKKALGIKREKVGGGVKGERKKKTAVSVGELMRVQLRVSEQFDSRVRRALLRIAASQLGKRIELTVLPLELLQQLRPSDFPNQQEFESFQKRNLKILEAGLLLYPQVPLDKTDASAQRLKQIIKGASEKPLETGKNTESMQVLRNVVMALACRSFDDTLASMCHWADGFPLNLQLYRMLLEACFDIDDETSIIDEVDEVLELIKKTWVILGINQELHNLCFAWVLYHRYMDTGEIEDDLLFAASNLLAEVEKDAKSMKDLDYSKVLSSTLSVVLGWAEKRLLTYHDTFCSGNIDLMQSVTSLAVISAKLLVDDISSEYRKRRKEVNVARDRVDTYIRSSIRVAFAQKMEKINLSKRSSGRQQDPIPVLSLLAQEVTELVLTEKEFYSPVLKRWHPLAAGVAVATLHSCFGSELKQFVTRISELTPDAVQVLIAADMLEKQLVQVAVEDAVDSDDGGKAIIKEMPPYEAEAVIGTLVKSWIGTRIDRLREWVDRNLQQEVWNVQANKERVGPSVIEIFRIVDETVDAFFLLPIPIQPTLVTELMIGLDRCIQQYVMKAKSGCGVENTYLPTLPALTRCSAGSKFFKKKEKSQVHIRRKSQAESTNMEDLFGISQLCVRINSMQRIRSGVNALEKKTITYLKNLGSTEVNDNGLRTKFELSIAASFEGILQLCKAIGYKIVFHELGHVLWNGLYVGEVSSSRIDPFLEEVEHYLEIIATTVHESVRTRVITDVMKASFHGFLLVLLAGGPSRTFTQEDSMVIEDDFKSLSNLFWSNGDGLPSEIIDKHAKAARAILPLFRADTEILIEQFKQAVIQSYGTSAKSGLPLPPTTGEWSATDPNTILRVLCHRDDEVAAKFLKRTYSLPTKLA
ncbi:protein unc-13 homolog [Silene latifolia]|uniref:protein unc-13 homolog n=1 Tax=Silene latifolia TaxID=37657 RepID=UPI003D783A03